MFKKHTLRKFWRGINIIVALAMIFSFHGSNVLQVQPVHATESFIEITEINEYVSPFPEFTCDTNPIFNPVSITGQGEGSAPPGQIQQYKVQVDWGDGEVQNDLGTFTPNSGQGPFTFDFEATKPTLYAESGNATITARLYHSQPPGNDNQADEVFSIPVCITTEPEVDLSIEKEVSDVAPIPGDTITYTLTVENLSEDEEATSVVVSDTLPEGVTYVSDDAGGSYDSDTREWTTTISSLESGESVVITITVTVDEGTEGETITNTVSVSGDEEDSDQTNNSDSDGGITVQTATFCGDGEIQSPNDDGLNEVCDDGELNGEPNQCNAQCTGITEPFCGNGIQEESEECDGEDGEFGEFQACGEPETDNACQLIDLTYCGDGIHQEQNQAGNGGTTGTGDEECDGEDGVVTEGFFCSASCVLVQSDDNASICGLKFEDINADATQDEDESGLADWVIILKELIDESYETASTTVTIEDGSYCFEGLSSGSYRVEEELQDDWFNATDLFFDFILGIGEEKTDVDFGNFQCVDEDQDGYFWPAVEQCGEQLDCDDTNATFQTQCDAECGNGIKEEGEECDGEDGEFGENEACGEPETDNACQIITPPFCGDGNIDEGEECDDGLQGSETCTTECTLINNSEEGAICGYKFEDTDQDNIFDNDESGISSWNFFASSADTVFTTLTNEEGRYCFMALGAGEWTIYEQIWDLAEMGFSGTWVTTTPATTTVTLVTNQSSEDNVNFGNLQCTDNDEDGYTAQGGLCGTPVDCNDEDTSTNPGASEICGDEIDNNCDGLIDEQDSQSCPVPEPESEPEPVSTLSGGGGGAGPTTLIIHTERVGEGAGATITVTITWHTNLPANSRVVYDTIAHPDAASIGGPNYSYANSTGTIDDDPKVTFHTVVIPGLSSETTYYFRPISAASPEVIGIELEHTTAPGGEESEEPAPEPTPEETPAPPASPAETGTVAGVATEEETGTVAGVEFEEDLLAQAPTESDEQAPQDSDESAVTPSADETSQPVAEPFDCTAYLWILIILNALAIVYASYRSKGAAKSKKNLWWIIGLLAVVPTVLGYPQCWLVSWLLLTLAAAVALIISLSKKQQQPQQPV